MSAITAGGADVAPHAERYISGRRVGDWVLAAVVFLGGFVIFEPAPYDLVLVPVILMWAFLGLRISRYILPMIVLMLLYLCGGLMAFVELRDLSKPIVYFATTGFLVVSAILFAAVIPGNPERRLPLMMTAYIASAVISSLIGILAYFGAFPSAEFFTLYERARGTFQDPNVFGPFLILPLVYLVQGILTSRLRTVFWPAVWCVILLGGIFLSFSRAAWGMSVFAILIVAGLTFINQRSETGRMRLIAYAVFGAITLVILLGIALSIPAISSLFLERAQLVQDYDAGELGRFERHAIGFLLSFDKPLGIGPFTFGLTYGEDEHNMWLKGFTVYGWLGGFSYITLVLATLIASFPLLFKARPWQGVVVSAFAVYLGHLLIHNVIDNDHWRHLFFIYGLLWGAFAAEKLTARAERLKRLPTRQPAVFHAPIARAAPG